MRVQPRQSGAAVVLALIACALAPAAASATPGDQLWEAHAPGNLASSVAVSRDGSNTFVGGYFCCHTLPGSSESFYGLGVIAYDPVTGAERGRQGYGATAAFRQAPVQVAVGSEPDVVYLMGSTRTRSDFDYTTIAFRVGQGQLWRSIYTGPAHGDDFAESLAASPDGSRVYVTGTSSSGTGNDILTIAYDAATGTRLWARRAASGAASAVAVSPDGTRVYVLGDTGADDCVLLAYDGVSGARLWQAVRRDCRGAEVSETFRDTREQSNPPTLVVSPTGDRVFVTARAQSGDQLPFAAAYDATTGQRVWTRSYRGPANLLDLPGTLAVSPDGATLYQGVTSVGDEGCTEWVTVAYNPSDGTRRWARRFGGPAPCDNTAGGITSWNEIGQIVVSPDSREVYVAGGAQPDVAAGSSAATAAYSASSGRLLWSRLSVHGFATGLAVSPDGARVITTGNGFSSFDVFGYATR